LSERGRFAARRLRAVVAAGLVVVGLLGGVTGCAARRGGEWGAGARFIGFDPHTRNPGGAADFTILLPLSSIFYERITARRFNSLATYEDPALREFFTSQSAFADYYAAFAEALEKANFESLRPTSVRLRKVERIAVNSVTIEVSFRGENGLPLRWWSTGVVREDKWEYTQGRWWVIPGKI